MKRARPSETLEPTFPPKKHHVDFARLSARNGRILREQTLWFEDSNSFYRLDFREGGSNLVFAEEKNLYSAPVSVADAFSTTEKRLMLLSRPKKPLKDLKFFSLINLHLDSRFIYEDYPGELRFGKFYDGNLGKLFYLSEPKDAEEVLLSFHVYSGSYAWLEASSNVSYYYFDDTTFTVHVAMKLGARFDEAYQIVSADEDTALSDRAVYQNLLIEELKDFCGLPVEKTRFKATVPEPSPEELALKEKTALDEKARAEKIQAAIESTRSILREYLETYLTEFGLEFSLEETTKSRRLGPLKVVEFRLFESGEDSKNLIRPIFRFPIFPDSFMVLSPEANAREIFSQVVPFLDRHRETFFAFKRIYDTNLAYHELVNPLSKKPILDYQEIFRVDPLSAADPPV